MSISKEHGITAALAAGFTKLSDILFDKAAEKIGSEITKQTQTYEELFLEILGKIQNNHRVIINKRLAEARFIDEHLENEMVRLLGDYLHNFTKEDDQIAELEQLALQPHIKRPANLTDEEWRERLKKEWDNPFESQFFCSIHILKTKGKEYLLWLRKTIAVIGRDLINLATDEKTVGAQELKKLGDRLEDFSTSWKKKRGYAALPWEKQDEKEEKGGDNNDKPSL